ncbi:ubiquitin/ribosomal protein S30e fusion protein-like [Aphis craccivora]|uniref:Ubiquitin/ribosomal protein S30e fusion protein-like n=1 Tax=Aphis craccivora TaxID=307492 RepID=A0A6G0X505_APHCR|nr:ubiquitin/ribosomal protein S30e fusion protein-like [Aphis craccivora]
MVNLFVRGQNVHALECQGFENISQIKVNTKYDVLNYACKSYYLVMCLY